VEIAARKGRVLSSNFRIHSMSNKLHDFADNAGPCELEQSSCAAISTADNNRMVVEKTINVDGSIDKVNGSKIIDVIGSIGREGDR